MRTEQVASVKVELARGDEILPVSYFRKPSTDERFLFPAPLSYPNTETIGRVRKRKTVRFRGAADLFSRFRRKKPSFDSSSFVSLRKSLRREGRDGKVRREREREREGEAGCKREQATARVCERERERERDREGKRERGRGREREGRELESVSSGWSNYPTVSRSGAARAAW